MLNKNIKFILGIIFGIIISGGIVYAVNVASSSVSYTRVGSSATNVESALNELYEISNRSILKMENMCPGCVYAFPTENWYLSGENQTVLSDESLYKDNWFDVVVSTGKKTFLGLVLDNSKKINKVYVCGIATNQPFCVESTLDNSKYEYNSNFLMKNISGCSKNESRTQCHNSVLVDIWPGSGSVRIYDGLSLCWGFPYGQNYVGCSY